MRTRRRDFHRILAASPLALWAGCSRTESGDVVRVSMPLALSMSSLYLARDLGYFEQAGLVELDQMPDSPQKLPLLASGKLDVYFNSMSPAFLNAVAKGARIKIVGGREVASPTCGYIGTLYGSRDAFPEGLSDLTQLRGKRLVFNNVGATSEFALDAHLSAAGLTRDDILAEQLRSNVAVAALLSGRVDAIIAHNEYRFDLASLSTRIVRGPRLGSILPNHQYAHILYGAGMLDRDPDVGVRFLVAYLRGTRAFLKGETPKMMVEYARSNDMDVDTVVNDCRETFTPDASVDMASLKRYVDWAVRRGYCSESYDVSRLVELRYVKEAQRRLGIVPSGGGEQ